MTEETNGQEPAGQNGDEYGADSIKVLRGLALSSEAFRRPCVARLTEISDGVPLIARKWRSWRQADERRGHITGSRKCWPEVWPAWSSVGWKPAEPTKFASIWRRSDVESSEIRCMAGAEAAENGPYRVSRRCFRGKPCMHTCLASRIRYHR